jgi:hypothetical protein
MTEFVTNEELLKQINDLKLSNLNLIKENEKLEEKKSKIRRVFGWEITEFFNNCRSFRETTEKYYFEDEYDCFCALEDYFGNPDFQWTANDYDVCYEEVFSIIDPKNFPPKNKMQEKCEKCEKTEEDLINEGMMFETGCLSIYAVNNKLLCPDCIPNDEEEDDDEKKKLYAHPTYKFRCECPNDYERIQAVCGEGMFEVKIIPQFIKEIPIPDLEVEFKSTLSYGQLLRKFDEVTDAHIAFQTLMPIEEYTGERDFDRITSDKNNKEDEEDEVCGKCCATIEEHNDDLCSWCNEDEDDDGDLENI